jgi:predicted metal-dependent HD superfamily phosphohydrolase
MNDVFFSKKQKEFNNFTWYINDSEITFLYETNESNLLLDVYLTDVNFYQLDLFNEPEKIFTFVIKNGGNPFIKFNIHSSAINLMDFNKHIFIAINNILALKYNDDNGFYYHTIEHIKNSLDELNKLENKLTEEEYKVLYLAICFHDALYKAGDINNELNAANCFIQNVGMFVLKPEISEWIKKLILSTKIGTNKEYIKSIKLADIMHDIDYIGFSTENHNVIAGLIYNENCALVKTHAEFNLLRAKFLIDLLLNGELFISKYFFKYNNIAYKNIKAEIQHLIK